MNERLPAPPREALGGSRPRCDPATAIFAVATERTASQLSGADSDEAETLASRSNLPRRLWRHRDELPRRNRYLLAVDDDDAAPADNPVDVFGPVANVVMADGFRAGRQFDGAHKTRFKDLLFALVDQAQAPDSLAQDLYLLAEGAIASASVFGGSDSDTQARASAPRLLSIA